jgi:hypothetical protein
MALDNLPCPSTRDFFIVDMDPSDNLQTKYLLLPGGITAQFSDVNKMKYQGMYTILKNPSDEALLSEVIYPLLNCSGFKALDLVTGLQAPSFALSELQASRFQLSPIANIEANNPMTLINGQPNLQKLNLYKLGIGEAPIRDLSEASTTIFCSNLLRVGLPRIQHNNNLFTMAPSPSVIVATNLYIFMLSRFSGTYTELNCAVLLGVPNPIVLSLINGLAVGAIVMPFN